MPPASFSFSRLLWLFGPFVVPDFRIVGYITVKVAIGIVGSVVWVHLGSVDILTVFPIQPVSTVYFPVYLCHLRFLSSIS